MSEQVWLWALLLSLCISLVIAWRTYPKGKQVNLSLIGTAIGQTLGRSFAFFAIICLPLVNQPRISSAIALPVAGMILVLCGITLVLVATRELTKTKFREWKGIPSKLITTGPYRVIT